MHSNWMVTSRNRMMVLTLRLSSASLSHTHIKEEQAKELILTAMKMLTKINTCIIPEEPNTDEIHQQVCDS